MGTSGGMATGQAQSRVPVDVSDTLFVEVKGSTARVRVPKVLQPVIGGRADGWWDLTGFTETPDKLSGQVRMSPLSRPNVVVDRRLGVVQLTGFWGDFRGNCTKEESATEAKF
jgi:hypothetical protein